MEFPGGCAAVLIGRLVTCDAGRTSSALSVYSGLGEAKDLGVKYPSASLAAMARASSGEISGCASAFLSDDTWTGTLRCIMGDVTDVPGVWTEREKSRTYMREMRQLWNVGTKLLSSGRVIGTTMLAV